MVVLKCKQTRVVRDIQHMSDTSLHLLSNHDIPQIHANLVMHDDQSGIPAHVLMRKRRYVSCMC